MKPYTTAQAAKLVGVHPNTVRFYEEMGLLPPVPRRENGYREFYEQHIEQLRLIRIAFDSEIIAGNLRKMTIGIVRMAAASDIAGAIRKTWDYKEQIAIQKQNAEEAIELIETILSREFCYLEPELHLSRREAAACLGVSVDRLRDWERNGLIEIPRDPQGHRIYGNESIRWLKIIRTLRDAHYSMMAILRMLTAIRGDDGSTAGTSLRTLIDTPHASEEIVTAADQFITSLDYAEVNAEKILRQLNHMRSYSRSE